MMMMMMMNLTRSNYLHSIIEFYLAITFTFSCATACSSCLSNAAMRWDVPESILKAIILQESGWDPDVCNINNNGSQDSGLMQINSVNINLLKSAGIISDERLLMQPCTNIEAGAYLLSLKFKKYGYTWRAVGAYHSETAHHGKKYADNIMKIVHTKKNFFRQKDLISPVPQQE
ncbi:lytic transglycosylase domain-containing protein [Serratia symbiotica]|uniref:lytic transglycosylase domain-containing protein n=1 Tax=Serratia symbiotica TaxID=138074 RepID=UPI001CF0B813|nr:lytic transglycosylase domain-containing protein [Serratia symbiotica]